MQNLNLHAMPKIMGVLNTTPDSFSDGGKFNTLDDAMSQSQQMIDDGVDIIDVGGESTRPGAAKVTLDEELERTIPVIEKITTEFDVRVSIDTSKPEVMVEAVNVGASLINDVCALQVPGALEAAAKATASNRDVEICLMHMLGQPDTMQKSPEYVNILEEIKGFFANRLNACENSGIDVSKIYLDPGFGFGKTLDHNYKLLGNLDTFDEIGRPLLIGLSRKSMIGNLLNRNVDERLAGSLTGAMLAFVQGAKIVRVHDVKETVDCLKVLQKTKSCL